MTRTPTGCWPIIMTCTLYAALRASAEYIQEDMLEDRYAGKYDRAIEKMVKHENRKRSAGAVPKQAYGNPRMIV